MGLIKDLLNMVFPPKCLLCGGFLWQEYVQVEGISLSICRTCFSEFRKITSPLCPVCGIPFVSTTSQGDHLCEGCLRALPFYEASGAPYAYEGRMAQAISLFKYGQKSVAADSLGPLLATFARTWFKQTCSKLIVMPVPLHPKRLRERGFNQSLLLARYVARSLETELDFLSLRRIKYTLPQTRLQGKERRKNVRGAFGIWNGRSFKGRRILLIDDVNTTGSTLNECSRVLKRAGCDKVFCLTLARTEDR